MAEVARSVDPITAEVLRGRLDSIANEMETALLRTAFSTTIKEGGDASAGIFDLNGETVAQAVALPAHLGMLIPAVKSIIRTFPPNAMRPGDVFIMNDPYDGGTHPPDVVLVMPVIFEEGTVLLTACIAHHQDMGGKSVGSMPTDATEVFQEGLIIPPMKLHDRGSRNEVLLSLLARNVRLPQNLLGDLDAQLACVSVGRDRLEEVLKAYGTSTVDSAIRVLSDRAELLTRAEIEKMPDGVYTFVDYLDNDGIVLDKRIRVQVAITISGSDFSVDFSGTSPQVRGGINSTPSAILSAVYYIVRVITDPNIPNNAGCYRPVHLHLPEGSLVNPRFPAAISTRVQTTRRVVDAMYGALAKAVPHKVPAAPNGNLLGVTFGFYRNGAVWSAYGDLNSGGMGGRPDRDGIDAITTDVGNSMNIPVEAVESDYPLRILRYRLRPDSGGPGKYRGGLGYERIFQLLDGEAQFVHKGERHLTCPWGLRGGKPARPYESLVLRRNGTTEIVPSKITATLLEGDQLHIYTAGGGGHGDPLERDPMAVVSDVLDRKVSLDSAREEYGVLMDASHSLDAEATTALRRRLTTSRGPVYWTYDRGGDLGKE